MLFLLEGDNGDSNVVVVVNGGVTPNAQTRSPGHPRVTTTIPVGECSSSGDPAVMVPEQAAHLKVSPAKKTGSPRIPGVAGEGKRATHEKNKSVTIVVNDQQVSHVGGEGTPLIHRALLARGGRWGMGRERRE